MIRFIRVNDGGSRYVPMCPDLTPAPADIIRLYTARWKIEAMFRLLKIYPGAFAYRFWSRLRPEVGRTGFSDYGSLPEPAKARSLQTIERIERVVNLTATDFGLMQYIAIKHPCEALILIHISTCDLILSNVTRYNGREFLYYSPKFGQELKV